MENDKISLKDYLEDLISCYEELTAYVENLMDLQAVALANSDKTEAKNIENLLKKN